MLPDHIIEKIEFEFEEIESLFELYKEELSNLEQKPSLFELTALGGILHSFYNGIEKILLIIAKGIDKKIPTDPKWHRSLLIQLAKKNKYRCSVLSGEVKELLLDYLGFRHFYRHSYSFHLEWEEMEELVRSLHDMWAKFKSEILLFIKKFGD